MDELLIYTTYDSFEANRIVAALGTYGIPAFKREKGAGQYISIITGLNTTQPIDIYIPKDAEERAVEILEDMGLLQEVEGEAFDDTHHFFFVRHGETVWNVENKICGATDIELTELGHKQAIKTGERILEMGIYADEILTSPLVRASETARHISEITGIPMRIEPRLIEQNFGKFEATARDGKDFYEAKKHCASRYEGGESMLQLAQRIYNLLDDIKVDDKIYILVAHNGIARIVQSYFYDMDNEAFSAFGVNNCEVIRYDFS